VMRRPELPPAALACCPRRAARQPQTGQCYEPAPMLRCYTERNKSAINMHLAGTVLASAAGGARVSQDPARACIHRSAAAVKGSPGTLQTTDKLTLCAATVTRLGGMQLLTLHTRNLQACAHLHHID
jgi:hypothetical protein